MLSLRAHVLLGAILWTIGLVVVSWAGLALVFQYFPHMPFLGRAGAIHVWVFHTGTAITLALLFMIAGIFQVRHGLSGITRLRARLGAVHEGREDRVEGRYVREVQPLVDDLNALLDHREQAVKRAIAKAGDLAHGLKTPLAVLAREAERASGAGHTDLAEAMTQQVERMRRQIDYHLAHARAAASGATSGARCSIKESADALARTLLRLHADRQLLIDVRASPSHVARVQREDLDELLGNLLDNACKWTRTRVLVDSAETDGEVAITIDDNGPGLAGDLREAVIQRGVRADERSAGTGFGLAIVRDLAEIYRGSIRLEDSPLGGLRARLTLPSN
ncbi:MAG TPA: sensor histidine kinase [Vicinamibacterales bacterium]|nr:sensor histidine kinase [Vicinamibacterales bacterium]